MLKYVAPSTGIEPSSPCYDEENVAEVGRTNWSECSGMLIVDSQMLADSASNR